MQTAQLATLLSTDLPSELFVKGRRYIPQQVVNHGKRGVVLRATDEYGDEWALKVCPRSDYEDRSFLQEVAMASKLRNELFARLHDVDAINIKCVGSVSVVCFVEEWITGQTLEEFVRRSARDVTTSFLLGYIKDMGQALSYLSAADLRHDDLLPKNVMICPPLQGSLSNDWSLKIVDMGSLKPKGAPLLKDADDHGNFVRHIVLLRNIIHKQRPAGFRERRFLNAIDALISSMLDDDQTIPLRDPAQIVIQFTLAYQRANAAQGQSALTLSSPFEFFSAEHIADDVLLVKLFAETCPWLNQVLTADPCLVTGPRGCGKSTIFRWMSLKARLHKSFEYANRLKIAGFYISCSMDLQNRLGWIKTRDMAELHQHEIVHYFNLVAGREVAATLQMIAAREDHDSNWGLGLEQEKQIHEFFVRQLSAFSGPRLQGVSRFIQVREMIERAMIEAHEVMLVGGHLRGALPETFLGDLTTLLSRTVSFFESKRIAFLVDDFSLHRLAEPVQVILNRVIWERRSSHVFKLSSEKYGASLTDSFDATIDVAREMKETDCGREYLSLDDSQQSKKALKFAIELLDRRLENAGYAGTARTLIGSSSWKNWKEDSLAEALAHKGSGRKEGHYHGLETISRLCSGDVASLLMVYNRIFELGGVQQHSNTVISPIVQDRAIRETSRRFFDAIRTSVPYGPEMYGIVNAFGNLVRNVLIEGRRHKKDKTTVRSQIPRIEIDQPSGSAVDQLSADQYAIAKELVRRAAFIEMEAGLSRHRNVTTLRWQLRRIYLPAFGAALSKNDAVKRDVAWFIDFLRDPVTACDLVWKAWPREQVGLGPLFEPTAEE